MLPLGFAGGAFGLQVFRLHVSKGGILSGGDNTYEDWPTQ